jgi:pimeloyl-ACP methyl ester carboxylesterase
VLSRYVPWLRLPLDVALDVDNHFREFPRHAIPRARIFSRYVALLESIAAQGYDRVVIVAHSQGTVISAELLRYLQHRARWLARTSPDDRVVRLWSQLEGKVDLFTAGCPLRQLYMARFPRLYEWVATAQAGDVGVVRWVNAYATGDYVGRWLWTEPPLYAPSPATTAMTTAEHDVCLGTGAHTHYFDQEQVLVARWIDSLVR